MTAIGRLRIIGNTINGINSRVGNPKRCEAMIKSAVGVINRNGRFLANTKIGGRTLSVPANTAQDPAQLLKHKLKSKKYFSADILTKATSEDILRSELKPYKNLCTEYYHIDKSSPPPEELAFFLKILKHSDNVLEAMSGSGRFLIPLMQAGVKIVGFDHSDSMLSVCRQQCESLGIHQDFFSLDSFKTFSPKERFSDVIIPSGSFCLVTNNLEIKETLTHIYEWLTPNGRFIFDVETIYSLPEVEGISSTSWVERADKSLIVLSSASRFDKRSKIQTTLNKYELWKEGKIIETELEEFKLRLYNREELISLLSDVGFACDYVEIPYTGISAGEKAGYIQLGCRKV